MEKHTVKKVVLIDKDSDGNALENPYYQLTLANKVGDILTITNEEGDTVTSPIRMSQKYVNNLFKQEQVDLEQLTSRQAHRLVKSMAITAAIDQKEKGETFVATKNSNRVNTGTDKKPNWVQPEPGQSYTIQYSGHIVDYDQDVIIDFNDDLADDFAFANAQRERQATAELVD